MVGRLLPNFAIPDLPLHFIAAPSWDDCTSDLAYRFTLSVTDVNTSDIRTTDLHKFFLAQVIYHDVHLPNPLAPLSLLLHCKGPFDHETALRLQTVEPDPPLPFFHHIQYSSPVPSTQS